MKAEIPSRYDPSVTEDKWYGYWSTHGFFNSDPDEREPYTIVIPPPNVTGVLHMGHMLNNTLQDVLIRRARMKGKNALWVPGTDHASIATEARVVAKLKEEGIDKDSLSREEFLKHAWVWKEKHGGIILEQLKKLGASCDWRRTKFTMDNDLSESVLSVFVDLYNKGKIYRGVRMVNWDPVAKTAVSDEEVNYREIKSKLYYVKYQIKNEDNYITIATTRPETILGDTAVCVNPHDERFRSFHGKEVIVPLVNRIVPVILDEYVDTEFGTGALKITPAHDENDYYIGLKHNLEVIDIFNDDGTLSENAQWFIGEDRFQAKEKIVEVLKDKGCLVKVEDYKNKIGFSERTDAMIEPKLSLQWFLKMKDMAGPALINVMDDQIKIHPSKFKNTYRHWMENVKDWCISRQLWWGQQIPAFYYGSGQNDYVVALTAQEAQELARKKSGSKSLTVKDLRQDEDVLDTWFSSWLWPLTVFDGIRNPENKDIKYYYPTNDLVTAPEILFFWVARMIMAGYEYRNEKPFHNVYLTGIVRDGKRRKMSKSLGNSPDPIELIKKYSADGVRVGMLLCSPAGNDLLFDESLTEQGRNFGNKVWNVFRLIKSWKIDDTLPQPPESSLAVQWFEARLLKGIKEIDDNFREYRISAALMVVYKLFWDEFSSWYLEIIKPYYQQPINNESYIRTVGFFEKLLQLLHPFMPFITEEIWQYLREREKGDSIMISQMPQTAKFNNGTLRLFEQAKLVIISIRGIRSERNIAQKEKLELLYSSDVDYNDFYDSIILKMANLSVINKMEGSIPDNTASFVVKAVEYHVPLTGMVNKEEELKKIENELAYTKGFLSSVMKKLENVKFINNAPADVLEKEYAKKADAENKIKVLQMQIERLNQVW